MVSRFLLGAAIGLVAGSGILVLISLNSPLSEAGAGGESARLVSEAPVEQTVEQTAPLDAETTAPLTDAPNVQAEDAAAVAQLIPQGFERHALDSEDISVTEPVAQEADVAVDVRLPEISPIAQGDVLAPPLQTAPEHAAPIQAVPVQTAPDINAVDETRAPLTPAEPSPEAPAQITLPLQAFARPFSNIDAKPLYAIILIDDGRADLDRVALARSGFPISFALDPLHPKAADFAQIYREAGQEVISLASVLPKNTKAAAVAQEFDQIEQVLPQSLAVMDLLEPRFQDDQAVATAVVKVLKDQGRGLVSWGGNGPRAEQLAQREGLEQAVIFRGLDFGDESQPVIRRYLDRAVFKAAQEGRVIVAGQATPQTIETLMAWSLEGKAAMVALAPISAVMAAPK